MGSTSATGGSPSLAAANSHLTSAQNAYNSALDADRAADAASYTAESSYNNAQSAWETANTAATKFDSQISTAQTASTTAEKAVTDATKAQTDAQKTYTDAQKSVTDATKAQTDAQKALDDATKSQQTDQKALDDAQKQLDTLQKTQTTDQKALDDAKSKVDAAQKALDTAKRQVDTAQKSVDSAQKDLDKADKAVLDAQKDLDKATKDVADRQKDVDAAQKAVTDAQGAVEKAQTAVTNQQGVVDRAQTSLDAATKATASAQTSYDKARDGVSRAQDRVGSAQDAVNSAQSEVNSAEAAVNAAQARVNANPKDQAAKNALAAARSRLSSARSKLSSARERLQAARTALEEAKRAAEEARRKLEEAKRKEAEAKKALEEAKKKLEDLKKQLADAKKKLEDAKKKLAEAKQKLEAAKQAEADAKKKLEDAKQAQADAKKKLEDAKQKLEDAKQAQEKAQTALDDAKKAQTDAQKKVDDDKKRVDDAKKKLDDAKHKVDDDKKKVDDAKKKVDDAKKRVDDAKKKSDDAKKQVDEAKKKVDDAKAKAKDASDKLLKLKTDQADAKKKADAAKTKLDAAKKDLDAKRTAAKTAQSKVDSARSDVSSAQAEVRKAETAGMSPQARKMMMMEERDSASQGPSTRAADIDKNAGDPNKLKSDQHQLQSQVGAANGAADSTRVLDGNDGKSKAIVLDNRTDDLYRQYFQTHDYYVDKDGTVYAARYDASSNSIKLTRTGQPVEPQGTKPGQYEKDNHVTLHNSGARDDSVTVHTAPGVKVPDAKGNPSTSSYTVTKHTDPAGNKTGSETHSQTTSDQKDGSTVTATQDRTYDAKDQVRHAEQSTTVTSATKTETAKQAVDFDEQGRRTHEDQSYEATEGDKYTKNTVAVDYDAATGNRTSEHHEDVNRDGTKETGQVSDTSFANDIPTKTTSHSYDTSKAGRSGDVDSVVNYDQYGQPKTSDTTQYDEKGQTTVIHNDSTVLNAKTYVRDSDNHFNVTDTSSMPDNVLKPSSQLRDTVTASGTLLDHADAASIDRNVPASGSAERAALLQDQEDYDKAYHDAAGSSERDSVMSDYWKTHQYYFQPVAGVSDDPLALAAEYTPASHSDGHTEYGYVTLARTGQATKDPDGADSTADIVIRQGADGTNHQTVKYHSTDGDKQFAFTANTVTGLNGKPTETELERNASASGGVGMTSLNRVTYRADGTPVTGFSSTAQWNASDTTLTERTDSYGTDGKLDDTKIHEVQQSRAWDQTAVDQFDNHMDSFVHQLEGGHFDINKDYTTITAPEVNIHKTVRDTDVDYDDQGVAIHDTIDEHSWTTEATRDTKYRDDGSIESDTPDANGVKVTETTNHVEHDNGGKAIYDDTGNPVVDGTITTHVRSRTFDPDDGYEEGHQWREVTDISGSGTVSPDGTKHITNWGPLQQSILTEGNDDDWKFDQKYLKIDGSLPDGSPKIAFDDDGKPVEYKEGDSYVDPLTGTKVTFDHDPGIHHEDLDFADHFDDFMDHYWSKIQMVAAGALIVAGAASFIFTGGLSTGLIIAGAALATADFAYTGYKYSQGEASLGQLALSGVGVALAVLPGVSQLTAGARGAVVAAEAGEGALALEEGSQGARALLAGGEDAATLALEGGEAGAKAVGVGTRALAALDKPVSFIASGKVNTLLNLGLAAPALPNSVGTLLDGKWNADDAWALLNVAEVASGPVMDKTLPGLHESYASSHGEPGGGAHPTGAGAGSDHVNPAGDLLPHGPGETTPTGGGPHLGPDEHAIVTPDDLAGGTSTSHPAPGTRTGQPDVVTGGGPDLSTTTGTGTGGAQGNPAPTTPTEAGAIPHSATTDGTRGAGAITHPASTEPAPISTGSSDARAAVDSFTEPTFKGADSNLAEHWIKHQAEYQGDHAIPGVKMDTPSDYLSRAQDLVSAARAGDPNYVIDTLPMAEGTADRIGVYNRETGELVVLDQRGNVESLHRLGIEKTFTTETVPLGGQRDFLNAHEILADPTESNAAALQTLDKQRAKALADRPAAERKLAEAEQKLNDLTQQHQDAIANGADQAELNRIRTNMENARRTVEEKQMLLASDADFAAYRDRLLSRTVTVARPTGEFDPARGLQEFSDSVAGRGDATGDSTTAGIFGRNADAGAGAQANAPAAGLRPEDVRPATSHGMLADTRYSPEAVLRASDGAVLTTPDGRMAAVRRVTDTAGQPAVEITEASRAYQGTPDSLRRIIDGNPGLVESLGGRDVVAAHPELLNNQLVVIPRSNGDVLSGRITFANDQVVYAEIPGATRTVSEQQFLAEFSNPNFDVGAIIRDRIARDPQTDVNKLLSDIIAGDPRLLYGREYRVLRSSQAVGTRAQHTISDGWVVMEGSYDGSRGTVTLTRENPQRPGEWLEKPGYPVRDLIAYNRSRLDGTPSPLLDVRVGDPNGAQVSASSSAAVQESAARARAYVDGIIEYAYTNWGIDPRSFSGMKIVVDSPNHTNNAAFSWGDDVLYIGRHTNGQSAAFDPSVLAHELGHRIAGRMGIDYDLRGPSGAIHEGVADYFAASYTKDWVVGRAFGNPMTGNSIRDVASGAGLITSRGQYDQIRAANDANYLNGVRDAQMGVEAHDGSGVISSSLRNIQQRIGWTATDRLVLDALNNPITSGHAGFDTFGEAILAAAGHTYGVTSPTYQAVRDGLESTGLARTWFSSGQQVHVLRSSGAMDTNFVFGGYDPRQPGYGLVVDPQTGALQYSVPINRIIGVDGVPNTGFPPPPAMPRASVSGDDAAAAGEAGIIEDANVALERAAATLGSLHALANGTSSIDADDEDRQQAIEEARRLTSQLSQLMSQAGYTPRTQSGGFWSRLTAR